MNFDHRVCAPVMSRPGSPMGGAQTVSTTQKDGVTFINDPSNHRELQLTSNGPGLDVKVFDTSTKPPSLDLSSWGDPHDTSKNGVTTDSHGSRTFSFKDGSTLNLGTANPDGSEPTPGQKGATYNSSAVYIPGNNPNSAAVVTHTPGGQPQATIATGSVGYIQSLKKEPAQAIIVGADGNFHSPDGRILTQQVQDAQDVITGGPKALRMASYTSTGMYVQAKEQEMFNRMGLRRSMHASVLREMANGFNFLQGNRSFMNFLYNLPGQDGLHQYKIMMGDTPYQSQWLAGQADQQLQKMVLAGQSNATFDHHFGYAGNGWQTQNSFFQAMTYGGSW